MNLARIKGWQWFLLIAYIVLCIWSQVVRRLPSARSSEYAGKSVIVRAVQGESLLDQPVKIAYQERFPTGPSLSDPVILLHGSPGRGHDFDRLGLLLASNHHLIAPDLPGFGNSTTTIPDYSIRAHARYVLQMMDAMKVDRFHIVGFSLGGGVALNLANLAPERVKSITMLSAIGVQEMELLGDYHLNHTIHGAQLAGIWLIRELIPHFGYFDDAALGIPYARNFYDTDQRPLRNYLQSFAEPMLIIHGRADFLVPVEAAIEHHRLVPQSELKLTDESHFMVFMNPASLKPLLDDFLARVESGKAVRKNNADPTRSLEAVAPFDPSHVPKAIGVTAALLFLLIAVATLVSEDLTCITAGLLVAQGRIGFVLAVTACLFGIFVGDLLLFAAGRFLGRPAIRRAPLKWFVREEDVQQSSAWFTRRGAAVIIASRFLPGMRLPTYFTAGLLNTSFWRFSFYFLIACFAWTPLLVALSMVLGGELIKSIVIDSEHFVIRFLLAAGIIFVLIKTMIRLLSLRGRRLLLSRWRRIRHWEFWPAWLFYPPVILYIAWLMIRYRSLSLFTLANPAIPGGGFIGESKTEILAGLKGADGFVARSRLLEASLRVADRIASAEEFMERAGLGFPVVLKPDAGQRGFGVSIVKSAEQMGEYLTRARQDTIIQEFAGGDEFGIFYYRYPREAKGRILAITEKRFPRVVGDGARTLEELILLDDRTVCIARFLLKQHQQRLEWVPGPGETVPLVELGTHCRGALFLDGGHVGTSRLEARIDEISRGYDGFFFGRYDLRTDSVEDLKNGLNFRVIELNGVTSEPTNIYDPRNGMGDAYRLLFLQWRIAFEIGSQNRAKGMKPTPVRDLIQWLIDYRRQSKFPNG